MSSKKSKSKSKKRNKPQRPRRPPLPAALLANVAVGERFDVLLKLKPTPAKDESDEDVGVFSRSARERLSPEMQAEADIVATALDTIAKGNYSVALESLACIGRASPYAQWRLFLRGLVAFYQSDLEGARANWSRLDRTRRPGRMAAVLLEGDGLPPLSADGQAASRRLVGIASELRLRAPLLAKARQIAAQIGANTTDCLTGQQVESIMSLYKNLRRVDAEFVLSFCRACMLVAFSHGQPEPLLMLKQCIPGPAHDPSWNLHFFEFFSGLEDLTSYQEESADQYINGDLPRIESITKELSQALASTIRLRQAQDQIQLANNRHPVFNFFAPRVDLSGAEDLLEQSIKLYPNREAHHELIALNQQKVLEHYSYSREDQRPKERLEQKLVKSKAALVKQFPDEIETVLWLVDRYFEDGEFTKASALVKLLDGQRLDDPRAKALPWKLCLLEAMDASRLKKGLPISRAALDAAEQNWPMWFSKDWLSFLRAACALRSGDTAEFERLQALACQACGGEALVNDMMTYAAMQQMNVVSTAVKPWRLRIEEHLKAKHSREALLQLGAFCWDIVRTGLRFRGYQLYAPKFGKQLMQLLDKEQNLELNDLLRFSCLWAGEHRFWDPDTYNFNPPQALAELAKQDAYIAAACLTPYLSLRHSGEKVLKARPQAERLAEAAKTERDPFYRHHLENISRRLLERAKTHELYNKIGL